MRHTTTLLTSRCGATARRRISPQHHRHHHHRTTTSLHSSRPNLSPEKRPRWLLPASSSSQISRDMAAVATPHDGQASHSSPAKLVNSFSYEPLEHEDEIRILTLHPSSDPDAALVGELTTESLSSTAPYDAISYVWGASTRSYALHTPSSPSMPSTVLPLTQSIHSALHRLRLPSQPRRLWADQVCINQDDVEERSRQVRLMNRVYRGAADVLVWLGPDDEGVAEEAMEMVRELAEVFGDEQRMEVFRREHLEGLGERKAEAWRPLSKLTKLPWWNRLWIVQEIGTAAPATLYWGPTASLPWSLLFFVSSILGQYFHHLRARFQVYTPNITYLHRRFVRPEDDTASDPESVSLSLNNRSNFIYELHRARHLLSKDPRDHVYAFLGHFSLREAGESLAALVPDYRRPVEDVYTDVAIRALRGPKALQVLAACQTTNSTKGRPAIRSPELSMPSWVPDWRAAPIHIIGSPATPHRAAGDTSPQLEIDEEKRTLHVCGKRIDTIARHSWEFLSHTFEMRQVGDRYRGTGQRILPLEALWQHTCGFGTDPFSLEPRYRDGAEASHEKSAFFALVQTLTNGCIGLDRTRPYHNIPPHEWLSHAASYLTYQLPSFHRALSQPLIDLAPQGDAFRWSREATLVSRYRRFAVTSSEGYYVLGPEALRKGDEVVVLRGGRTPFVIREVEDGKWTLLGECYVHGAMNGEGFEEENKQEEWFTIV